MKTKLSILVSISAAAFAALFFAGCCDKVCSTKAAECTPCETKCATPACPKTGTCPKADKAACTTAEKPAVKVVPAAKIVPATEVKPAVKVETQAVPATEVKAADKSVQ